MSLPPRLDEIHRKAFVENLSLKHPNTITDASAYSSHRIDNSFDIDTFDDNFSVNVISSGKSIKSVQSLPEMPHPARVKNIPFETETGAHVDKFRKEMDDKTVLLDDEPGDIAEFDLVGIDPAIANTLRRIMIAEVPTMAIEKVEIYQNTSIIADEVIAHRIGLIPIRADPRKFKFKGKSGKLTAKNVLVFNLHIKCEMNDEGFRNIDDFHMAAPERKYTHSKVYSRDLQWVPQGKQKDRFAVDEIGVLHQNIILAELRPGQEIELVAYAELGIGKDHAKWSPVCTASYRLLPEVTLTEHIDGEEADQLVATCPIGVFDIEDVASTSSRRKKKASSSSPSPSKRRRAVVARPRSCTQCRECIRRPQFQDRVQLRRIKEHFIFTVESVGQYRAAEILPEALKVLKRKALRLKDELLSVDEDDEEERTEAAAPVGEQQDVNMAGEEAKADLC